VVVAALYNALRVVDKQIADVRIVMSGAGAAGTAVIKLLLAAGARNIVVADIAGVVHRGRADLTGELEWLAHNTNQLGFTGSVQEAVVGADVFIGLSVPGVLSGSDVAAMADRSIVFALANPDPEVDPAEASRYAAVVATGRSDFPNQINNVLAFPGVFRGLLDAHCAQVTSTMLLAAARALAGVVTNDELNAAYIVPSVFHADVHHTVAAAVRRAAGGPTELPTDTEVVL
jgi:malate dehydrogenase (oxaloacetate-decarboxylating)